MIDLQPCATCGRHVASTEPACPFCGAAVSPVPPRPGVRRGLSRAALFASATLATAAACGGSKAKPDPMTGAPTADAGVDAAADQNPDLDTDQDMRQRVGPPDMPYGAPPARRRVV